MNESHRSGRSGSTWLLLEFEYAATARPCDCGWSRDPRDLAVWFEAIDVVCARSGRRLGRLEFAGEGASAAGIYGLSHVEKLGRWSQGPRTALVLQLDEPPSGPVRLEIAHTSMGPRGDPSARLRVNGRFIGDVDFGGGLASVEIPGTELPKEGGFSRNASIDPAADVEVSIIVPTCDRPALTYASTIVALASDIGVPFELILVDNGSDPTSRDRLLDMGLPATILTLTERVAFGTANNLAAEAARGRILLLLNNDAFMAAGCVDRLVAEVRRKGVGAAGPVFRFPDGTLQENGRFTTPVGTTFTPLGNGFSWDMTRAIDVDYVSGACLAVRKRDYLALGGFDPALEPSYVEDVEFCLRLRAAGKKTRFVPDAVVFHIMGATSRGNAVDNRAMHVERNRHVMLSRWGGWLVSRRGRNGPRPLALRSRGLKRQFSRFHGESLHAVIVSDSAMTGPRFRAAVAFAAAMGRESPTVLATATRRSVLDVCQIAAGMGLPCEGLTTATIEELVDRDVDTAVVVGDLAGSTPAAIGRRRVLFCPFRASDSSVERGQVHSRLGAILNFDTIVTDSEFNRRQQLDLIGDRAGSAVAIEVLTPDIGAGVTVPATSRRSNIVVSLGLLAPDDAGGRHEATRRAMRRLVATRRGERWQLVVAGDFPPTADAASFHRLITDASGPIDVDILAAPTREIWSRLVARARILVVSEDAVRDRACVAAEVATAHSAGCVPLVCGSGPLADMCRDHRVGIVCPEGRPLVEALQAAARLADAGIPSEDRERLIEAMRESHRAGWSRLDLGRASVADDRREDGGPRDRPAALIVLGSHRSGTSVMTRLLSLAGADLPHDLMPPASDNPTGFWESTGVVAWNDAYLRAHDSSWEDPLAFFSTARSEPPSSADIADAADMIQKCYPGNRAIVLKDPRISLLSRLWIAAARRAGYVPVVVAMLRDPREVAASLAFRNRLSSTQGIAIWVGSTLAVELDTRDTLRRWISYEAVLESPGPVVRQVISTHDVGYARRDGLGGTIPKFVDRGRRHHRVMPGDTGDVDDRVIAYYRWLTDGCPESTPRPEIEHVMRGFEEAARPN